MKNNLTKCIVVRKKDILKVLTIPAKQGKRLLPWINLPQTLSLPFNILEDVGVTNKPEVHRNEGDYWECLEGEVFFVCGGKLVNPNVVKVVEGKPTEWIGDAISGGKKILLKPGDRLWIPPGTPHTHWKLRGSARLMIVKIR